MRRPLSIRGGWMAFLMGVALARRSVAFATRRPPFIMVPRPTSSNPKLNRNSRLYATISEAQQVAQQSAHQLCNDELSQRASQTFGGIPYYNTNIDNRFRVLFVLGGPGAGKGTQSDLMVQQYPVVHFSVGHLLRNISEQSPYKTTVEQALVSGNIVPVEISLGLLQTAMQEAQVQHGRHVLFLVDGFPRNYDNLVGYVSVMKDTAVLEGVLCYQCPLNVLQDRILERAKSSGRSDDNLESVRKRFDTFKQQTVPVVDILKNASRDDPRWSVEEIAGDRSIEDVWWSTQQVLNRLIVSDVLTANAALLEAVQSQNIELYESVCDPEFFSKHSPEEVFQKQEGKLGDSVQCAQVEVMTGRQVTVSYNCVMDGVGMKETRVWSYQDGLGWRNVHFSRTPLPS